MPRDLHEFDAPDQHEKVRRQHADLEKPAMVRLGRFLEEGWQHADADMQIFAGANDAAGKNEGTISSSTAIGSGHDAALLSR
jgi:hypothetical protein